MSWDLRLCPSAETDFKKIKRNQTTPSGLYYYTCTVIFCQWRPWPNFKGLERFKMSISLLGADSGGEGLIGQLIFNYTVIICRWNFSYTGRKFPVGLFWSFDFQQPFYYFFFCYLTYWHYTSGTLRGFAYVLFKK